MKKSLITVAALVALALSVPATAQQNGRGGGNGNNPGAGSGTGPSTGTSPVDVLHPVTYEGTVVSFTAAAGAGMPTLVVRDSGAKDTSFVLGPYRYLVAQHFAAVAGDKVKVIAYPCTSCSNGMAVGQVTNVTKNLTVNLRAADGTPLFSGKGRGGRHGGGGAGYCGGQGNGNGPQGNGNGPQGNENGGQGLCGGTGPDMARAESLEGAVKSFSGGPGVGRPTLVFSTSKGDRTVVLSPYRALRVAGFTPAEGAKLTIRMAPVTIDGTDEWVAISVSDPATGFTLALRDATTGRPQGGRCRS